MKVFNCISQSQHSTFYSGKGIGLLVESVIQYSTLMLSSWRGHSIGVSDNIYRCHCGFSYRCFSKIMNFQDRFRKHFQFTVISGNENHKSSFDKKLFRDSLKFPKKYLTKTAWWNLYLLMLQLMQEHFSRNFLEFSKNLMKKQLLPINSLIFFLITFRSFIFLVWSHPIFSLTKSHLWKKLWKRISFEIF